MCLTTIIAWKVDQLERLISDSRERGSRDFRNLAISSFDTLDTNFCLSIKFVSCSGDKGLRPTCIKRLQFALSRRMQLSLSMLLPILLCLLDVKQPLGCARGGF